MGFRIGGLGLRGLGFRVQGSGFRVLGFRMVEGLGIACNPKPYKTQNSRL